MTKGLGMLLAFAAICVLFAGCDDDGSSTSMVPESPLGLLLESEAVDANAGPQLVPAQDSYFFILVWLDGPVAVDMHNVYRKDGDSTYVKLNSEILRRGRIFGAPTAPIGLGYIDATFDIEYPESYSYRVTATNSHGAETAPSAAITVVPTEIEFGVPVTGLVPDDPYLVNPNTSFSWDPLPGAASYCVILLEESPIYGGIPTWIYQTTETEISLKSDKGVTYVDGMGSSLLPDTDYAWLVWAVDSNNIGYAYGGADFSTTDFVATVLNEDKLPGERSVEWDQIDYNGMQAPPGDYELRFTTADYDTTLDFEIVESTKDQGLFSPTQLPTRTSVWMDTYTHVLGDSIVINYELPAQTHVLMQVYAK